MTHDADQQQRQRGRASTGPAEGPPDDQCATGQEPGVEPLDGVGGERVGHDGEERARLVDGREPEQAAHRRAVGPPSQHDRGPERDEEHHVGHGQGDAAGADPDDHQQHGHREQRDHRRVGEREAEHEHRRRPRGARCTAAPGPAGPTPNMRASRVTTDTVHSSGPWRRARRVMRRPPERSGMRVRPRPVRAGSDAAGRGRRRHDRPGGRTARPTRPAARPGPPATRRRRSACAGSAPAIRGSGLRAVPGRCSTPPPAWIAVTEGTTAWRHPSRAAR